MSIIGYEKLLSAIFEEEVLVYPHAYFPKNDIRFGKIGEIIELNFNGRKYQLRKITIEEMVEHVLLSFRVGLVLIYKFGLKRSRSMISSQVAEKLGMKVKEVEEKEARDLQKLRLQMIKDLLANFLIPSPEDNFEAKQILSDLKEELSRFKEIRKRELLDAGIKLPEEESLPEEELNRRRKIFKGILETVRHDILEQNGPRIFLGSFNKLLKALERKKVDRFDLLLKKIKDGSIYKVNEFSQNNSIGRGQKAVLQMIVEKGSKLAPS